MEGQLSKRWGGNISFGTLSDLLLGICGNMKSKAKIFTDHVLSIASWKIYPFHFACIYLFTTEAIKHFLTSSDFFIKQKHKVQENSDKRILQKRKTDISIKAIVLFLETYFCLCLKACSLQCFHYIRSFVEAGLILDS